MAEFSWTPVGVAEAPPEDPWVRGVRLVAQLIVAGMLALGALMVWAVNDFFEDHKAGVTRVVLAKAREQLLYQRAKQGGWPAGLDDCSYAYDGWNRPLVYRPGVEPRVGSWGADGEPGGAGRDADVFVDLSS